MIDNITLRNGYKLRCYPKRNYVQPKYYRPLSRETIRANKRLFYTNVYNFIDNADKIHWKYGNAMFRNFHRVVEVLPTIFMGCLQSAHLGYIG